MNKDETFRRVLPGLAACPRCGREFACGMRAGSNDCWRAELPLAVRPDSAGTACYCPDCLKAIIAAGRHNACTAGDPCLADAARRPQLRRNRNRRDASADFSPPQAADAAGLPAQEPRQRTQCHPRMGRPALVPPARLMLPPIRWPAACSVWRPSSVASVPARRR